MTNTIARSPEEAETQAVCRTGWILSGTVIAFMVVDGWREALLD